MSKKHDVVRFCGNKILLSCFFFISVSWGSITVIQLSIISRVAIGNSVASLVFHKKKVWKWKQVLSDHSETWFRYYVSNKASLGKLEIHIMEDYLKTATMLVPLMMISFEFWKGPFGQNKKTRLCKASGSQDVNWTKKKEVFFKETECIIHLLVIIKIKIFSCSQISGL